MKRFTTAADQVSLGVVSPDSKSPRNSDPTWRDRPTNHRPRTSTGLRTARDRVFQTLWFESIGLAVVTPISSHIADTPLHDCLGVLALVSLIIMIWSAAFNTVFDLLEHRLTGRRASDRPHRLRVVHTLAHEATATVISCPVIYAMTELGWWEALQTDVALAMAYSIYGYLFYWCFDRLLPLPALGPQEKRL